MPIEVTLTPAAIPRPCPLPVLETCGAVAEFYGTVRGEEAGEPIGALVYEAYEPMAQRQMERLAASLLEEYPCTLVRVIHRFGIVPVGEAAIYIGILAPHRREAFGFLSAFMDRLKTEVPIWKIKTLPR